MMDVTISKKPNQSQISFSILSIFRYNTDMQVSLDLGVQKIPLNLPVF